MTDVAKLAGQLRAGDRRALAQAITLIESTRPDHRRAAEALLAALLPHSGGSIRIAISGVPGVGKSTFIEALGQHVITAGHKVAVLAVDPSSQVSGGSILGDKTRMERLAQSPQAFIRPTPTAGTRGGVARRTREALLACEAAGFDVVLVETVGVGQSETAAAEMVDMFVLLLLPGSGDELQGLKRGIVELADLVVVNKADHDMVEAAGRLAGEYANALHLLRPASPHWTPQVVTCSALEGTGIGEIWRLVEDYRATMTAASALAARRAHQARTWMWREVDDSLLAAFRAHPAVAAQIAALESKVEAGTMTPAAAAEALLAAFRQAE